MSIPNAVAVFCGSNSGNQPAFTHAAQSLGRAIAKAGKGLVYGGGAKGIMGIVSGSACEAGANVTGIVPYAMVMDDVQVEATGEADLHKNTNLVLLDQPGREMINTIVVHSMHERKVEMSKRVSGFFGLPGGFGTFEEVLEVITWTQIGLHAKPVVLLNVMGFYDPLRDLIRSAIRSGFIQPQQEGLLFFIDGPSDLSAHETFDWGTPALSAMDRWEKPELDYGFDWTKNLANMNGTSSLLDAC